MAEMFAAGLSSSVGLLVMVALMTNRMTALPVFHRLPVGVISASMTLYGSAVFLGMYSLQYMAEIALVLSLGWLSVNSYLKS